ncbi:MAG: HAD-IA family hydrolase [Acidobacteriota bacterium]|nr:HAD-IA family hydrolase [Acidobacteriota bacterium]
MIMDKHVTANWKQVRLLVFDLDGTLVDSKQDLALSVNAMRTDMGLPTLSLDLIASYVGQGVALLVRRSLGSYATAENVEEGLAFFLKYYHEHMLDNTLPYPGVAEALEKLAGKKMAVLTNKPVNFSREMLTRLGFARHFSYIYGGNSFPQKKPDPVGLHKLMEDLKTSAHETLMVGDSDTDVLTGRNAGVLTCGVTYGFGAHTLEKVSPDLMIDDMRQLPALLNGHHAE